MSSSNQNLNGSNSELVKAAAAGLQQEISHVWDLMKTCGHGLEEQTVALANLARQAGMLLVEWRGQEQMRFEFWNEFFREHQAELLMTDRVHSLQVVLERDIRVDEGALEDVRRLILMIRGVIAVEPVLASMDSAMAEERARHELRIQLSTLAVGSNRRVI